MPDSLYSHHIFLFPFKWVPINQKGEPDQFLEKQTALEQLKDIFNNPQKLWKEEIFQVDTPYNYNEYNYFYDYVSEILYDLHGSQLNIGKIANMDEPKVIQHYAYKLEGKATYCIETEWKENEIKRKTYNLEVESILLHLYYTGVGVLSFHLNNREEDNKSPDDILRINQFGRRLYPPFFGIHHNFAALPDQKPDNHHFITGLGRHTKIMENNGPTPKVIGLELARSITLNITGKSAFKEDFGYYEHYENFQHNPFRLPAFIRGILPDEITDENDPDTSKQFYISPVLDDRMFTVCWYGNNKIANRLYRKPSTSFFGLLDKLTTPLRYLSDEWWYKYVFVDAGMMTCQNVVMQEELIRPATNARWANYGTYFGMTNYSFMMLTSDLESLGSAAFLVNHLRSIYYKLSELVLVQRACVQRFSDEVTQISKLEEKDKNLSERVGSLYKQYIRFVNKIYFREVTTQAQGIELYQQLQAQCSIEKLVKDLDGEISELHNYVLLIEEHNRNIELARLTKLGSLTLAPGLILAYYGVSIMPQIAQCCSTIILSVLPFFLVPLAWFAYRAFLNNTRRAWVLLGCTGLLAIAFPIVMINTSDCKEPKPVVSDTKAEQVRPEQIQELRQQLQHLNTTVDSLYQQSKTLKTPPAHGRQ